MCIDICIYVKDRDDKVYPDLEALIDHCTRIKRLRVLLTRPCELALDELALSGSTSTSTRASMTTTDDDEEDDDEGDEEHDINDILDRVLRTAGRQQTGLRYVKCNASIILLFIFSSQFF